MDRTNIGFAFGATSDFRGDIVRGGINYKFNKGARPSRSGHFGQLIGCPLSGGKERTFSGEGRSDKPSAEAGPPETRGSPHWERPSRCNYLDFGVVSSLSTLAPGTEVLSVLGEDGLAPTVFPSCFRA
jgi:hypothetical protein